MSSSGPTEDELAQQARSWGRITNLSRQLESFGITLNNTYYIDKPKFTIGRNPNNDLVLSHQGISGSHCVIESNNDYSFLIQDNSTNGTYVNGQRIQRGQKLEFDWGARVDIVRLGQARITFVISATKGKSVLLHNKFLVRSHLGNGAYAKVQLVYNLEDRQQYALKNIDRKLFGTGNVQGGESTLLNEVRILKTMNHYGVVRAYDHYINDSRFYIVLDYVPGGDLLDRLIERRKPLPPEEAKDIFVQLTEAIAYLHDHGVVHRDIKPENILIDDREYYRLLAEQKKVPQFSQSQGESQPSTQREMSKKTDETTKERYRITDEIEKEYRNQPSLGASNLRVKLTDFGLSKQMNLDGPEKTTTLERFNTQDYDDAQLKIQTNLKPFTTACGTPQYLAPEVLKIFISQQQGKRGPVNQASVGYGREVDLWSLGAILYVMLTLHTPFDEATLYEQAPLGNYQRQRVEKMPQDILALLDGLFQPDPAKRYTIADVKANPWCADLFEQRARELEEKGSIYSQSQMQKRRDEKNRMDQLQVELDKEEAKRNSTNNNNNNNNNKNNNLAMTMTDTVLGANDQVQLPRPSKPSLMHDDSLAPMSSGDGTNTGTKRKTNDHEAKNNNNNINNNNYNNNNNQNRHITDDDTNAQHTNKRQRPN